MLVGLHALAFKVCNNPLDPGASVHGQNLTKRAGGPLVVSPRVAAGCQKKEGFVAVLKPQYQNRYSIDLAVTTRKPQNPVGMWGFQS